MEQSPGSWQGCVRQGARRGVGDSQRANGATGRQATRRAVESLFFESRVVGPPADSRVERGPSVADLVPSGSDLDALAEGWVSPEPTRHRAQTVSVGGPDASSALERDTLPDAVPFGTQDAGAEPRPTLVVCPSCGHGNGMRFFCCTVCGLRLHGTESSSPPVDAAPPKRRSGVRWRTGLTALLVLLMGAMGGKVVAGETEPLRHDGLVRGTRVANAPMVCDAMPVGTCSAVPSR
jgi:hypothetical protein